MLSFCVGAERAFNGGQRAAVRLVWEAGLCWTLSLRSEQFYLFYVNIWIKLRFEIWASLLQMPEQHEEPSPPTVLSLNIIRAAHLLVSNVEIKAPEFFAENLSKREAFGRFVFCWTQVWELPTCLRSSSCVHFMPAGKHSSPRSVRVIRRTEEGELPGRRGFILLTQTRCSP